MFAKPKRLGSCIGFELQNFNYKMVSKAQTITSVGTLIQIVKAIFSGSYLSLVPAVSGVIQGRVLCGIPRIGLGIHMTIGKYADVLRPIVGITGVVGVGDKGILLHVGSAKIFKGDKEEGTCGHLYRSVAGWIKDCPANVCAMAQKIRANSNFIPQWIPPESQIPCKSLIYRGL